jgi:hypothetical protein
MSSPNPPPSPHHPQPPPSPGLSQPPGAQPQAPASQGLSNHKAVALAPTAPPADALTGSSRLQAFTPHEMTAAILELGQAVAGIRAFLVGPYTPPPPLPPPQLPPPQQSSAPATSYQYGMPLD